MLRDVFNVEKTAKGAPTPVTGDLSHDVFAQMAVVSLDALVSPDSTNTNRRACDYPQVGAIGLPGYYVAVYLMDKWGRKKIQLQVQLRHLYTPSTSGCTRAAWFQF